MGAWSKMMSSTQASSAIGEVLGGKMPRPTEKMPMGAPPSSAAQIERGDRLAVDPRVQLIRAAGVDLPLEADPAVERQQRRRRGDVAAAVEGVVDRERVVIDGHRDVVVGRGALRGVEERGHRGRGVRRKIVEGAHPEARVRRRERVRLADAGFGGGGAGDDVGVQVQRVAAAMRVRLIDGDRGVRLRDAIVPQAGAHGAALEAVAQSTPLGQTTVPRSGAAGEITGRRRRQVVGDPRSSVDAAVVAGRFGRRSSPSARWSCRCAA